MWEIFGVSSCYFRFRSCILPRDLHIDISEMSYRKWVILRIVPAFKYFTVHSRVVVLPYRGVLNAIVFYVSFYGCNSVTCVISCEALPTAVVVGVRWMACRTLARLNF